MSDQATNVIDLRERMDNGEKIPVSELCEVRDLERLRIEDAAVTVVGSLPVPGEEPLSDEECDLLRGRMAGHLERARAELFELLKKSDRLGERKLHVSMLILVAELDSHLEDLAMEYGDV